MTAEVDTGAQGLRLERGLLARYWLLGAVLVAEAVAVTVSFESPAASAGDAWPVRVAAGAPELMRIAAASLASLALLLAPRFRQTVNLAQRSAGVHKWRPWLFLNLLAFAALYLVLARAGVQDGPASGRIPASGLILSEGLAIATVAGFCWLFALAPVAFWRVFVAREALTLLAAVATAVAAWLGGELAQLYWRQLASGTLFLTDLLLRLVYPIVASDPSRLLIGTPKFLVLIAPQCSGYEGIALVTVFLALYLWLFRARIRFPHALLLFPAAVLAVWLANVLRIVALVAIGTSLSSQLSVGAFHSQAGWISFIGIALGIIAATHRMRFFASNRREISQAGINPTVAALLVPFLVWVASNVISAAVPDGAEHLYPVRIVAIVAALVVFRRVYAGWNWQWSWSSVGIGGAVFVVWVALDRLVAIDHGVADPGTLEPARDGTAIWLAFRVLGSVLLVPLVEEMAFRGYLLRRLSFANFDAADTAAGRSAFSLTALVASSGAFGVLHGRWLAGTLAGMGYALAMRRSARCADAVAAHITTNALIALTVLIAGWWELWL